MFTQDPIFKKNKNGSDQKPRIRNPALGNQRTDLLHETISYTLHMHDFINTFHLV